MPRRSKPLFAAPEGLGIAFGESRYPSGIGKTFELTLSGTKRELRGKLREKCPSAPGVYGFVDRLGKLTYVGMSKNLRRRLTTYLSSRAGHRKEFRIGRKCLKLFWQPVAHTFVARLRELELIHRFRPHDNVEGQPSRRSLGYIVLSGHDAQHFEIKAEVPRKTRHVWGPLPICRRTRDAVEELNRAFLLRDCPPATKMRFRDELPLLEGNEASPCLRADLKTCLAPCIGGCSRTQYSRSLGAARRFLDGDDVSILETLAADMQQAVDLQRFEKAARIRDVSSALSRLDMLLRWFHDWIERATFVYAIPAMHGDFEPHAIVVVRGQIVEVAPAADQRQRLALLRKHAKPTVLQKQTAGQRLASLPPEHFEIARFLFTWFRRFPDERERLHRLKTRRRAA